MEAKEERPHPICEEHRQPIKLICTDVQCTSNPLVCSVCLCEKKDYHKRPQGMIHQLRELLPLVEKAFLIERSSEERFKKTDKLAHNYFDALRTKLKTLVDVSEQSFMHKLKLSVSPSTLTVAQMEVIQHLKYGAYDQILPRNLSQGADKIMGLELHGDHAELNGLHRNLESCLTEKNIDQQIKNLTPSDVLTKLLLSNWNPRVVEENRSPLLEYDRIIAAYHRLQGPLEWRNCGSCYFTVALFREQQTGSEKMYKELAVHEKRTIVTSEHPGNGGSFSSDCTKDPIFKSAALLANEIKQKLRLKDIYNDILVVHGKASGWAFNAEEGSMAAFGGPEGKGFSFCRGGEKVKKKIHLFVFN